MGLKNFSLLFTLLFLLLPPPLSSCEPLDDNERSFQTILKGWVLLLMGFTVLFSASHLLVKRYHVTSQNHSNQTAQDATRSELPLFLCTVGITIAVAAMGLVPCTMMSNWVLLQYPDDYYVVWLDRELILGLWNLICISANLWFYGVLPFAYLHYEAEGMGGKRSAAARTYEAVTVLAIVVAFAVIFLWVLHALIEGNASVDVNPIDQRNSTLPKDPSPKRNLSIIILDGPKFVEKTLVYCNSFSLLLGSLVFLVCSPVGFFMMCRRGLSMIKPWWYKDDLSTMAASLHFEVIHLLQKKKALSRQLPSREVDAEFDQEVTSLRETLGECNAGLGNKNKQLSSVLMLQSTHTTSHLILSNSMAICILLSNFCFAAYTVLRVLFYLLLTLFNYSPGDVYNFLIVEEAAAQHTSRLVFLLDTGSVIYMLLAGVIGFYSFPIVQHLLHILVGGTSTPTFVILTATILLVSASFPVSSRILFMTQFELMGVYRQTPFTSWSNFLLFYRTIFVFLWCTTWALGAIIPIKHLVEKIRGETKKLT